jgi:hypothetical protein
LDIAVVTPGIVSFRNTNAILVPQQQSANGFWPEIQDWGFTIFLIMVKHHDKGIRV